MSRLSSVATTRHSAVGTRPAHTVLAATIILGGVLVVGLTAASASVYDAVVEKDGVSGLDLPVLNRAMSLRTPLRTSWSPGSPSSADRWGCPSSRPRSRS